MKEFLCPACGFGYRSEEMDERFKALPAMTQGQIECCARSILRMGVPASAVLKPSPARDAIEKKMEELKMSPEIGRGQGSMYDVLELPCETTIGELIALLGKFPLNAQIDLGLREPIAVRASSMRVPILLNPDEGQSQ